MIRDYVIALGPRGPWVDRPIAQSDKDMSLGPPWHGGCAHVMHAIFADADDRSTVTIVSVDLSPTADG